MKLFRKTLGFCSLAISLLAADDSCTSAGDHGSGAFPPYPRVTYKLQEGSLLGHQTNCAENTRVEPTIPIQGTFDMSLNQHPDYVSGLIENVDFFSLSGPAYHIIGGGEYSLDAETQGLDLTLSINELHDAQLTSELHFGQTFPRVMLNLFQLTASNDCFELFVAAAPIPEHAARFFLRGDANGDGAADISDALAILGTLFLGGPPPACLDADDGNDDGVLDISDPVALLGSLFLGTGLPPVPSPLCGLDPTDDSLDCSGQPACLVKP